MRNQSLVRGSEKKFVQNKVVNSKEDIYIPNAYRINREIHSARIALRSCCRYLTSCQSTAPL